MALQLCLGVSPVSVLFSLVSCLSLSLHPCDWWHISGSPPGGRSDNDWLGTVVERVAPWYREVAEEAQPGLGCDEVGRQQRQGGVAAYF